MVQLGLNDVVRFRRSSATGEREIQMYMYDLWVSKCQCMCSMVGRSCVGWCGVEFGCTKPRWEAQASHGPLRGAQWLKTIGISVKWCDMCMCRSLSVRRALLQRWKKRSCRKKGRERRIVGWGGGRTKALAGDKDSNCNSTSYSGSEAGFLRQEYRKFHAHKNKKNMYYMRLKWTQSLFQWLV